MCFANVTALTITHMCQILSLCVCLFTSCTIKTKGSRNYESPCTTIDAARIVCERRVLCNGRASVRLSVCPIIRPSPLRVCCCAPGGQQISIDCCTAGDLATTALCQPFTTTTFAKRAFRCSAPAVWNSLPETVLSSDSAAVFLNLG